MECWKVISFKICFWQSFWPSKSPLDMVAFHWRLQKTKMDKALEKVIANFVFWIFLRKCLNVHTVCTNFGLNVHTICTNFGLKCTYHMYQFRLNCTYPSLFCYCVKMKKMYVHPWESARIGKKEIPWSPQSSSAPFILLPNTWCRANPGVVAAPHKIASCSHISVPAIGPVHYGEVKKRCQK